jgi:hypothetical protein
MTKISWSDCHIVWLDDRTIEAVHHLQTGVEIAVGKEVSTDRDRVLAKLETAVFETHSVDKFGAFSER